MFFSFDLDRFTAVSVAGLRYPEKLPALEVLLIGESKVMGEDAKSLLKALPNLRFSDQT